MNPPYRVKDKVTGLYYCPSRSVQVKSKTSPHVRYVKSNLSKRGKIYWSDPRKHIKSVYDHTKAFLDESKPYDAALRNHVLREFVESEWELEAVKSS